MPRAVRGRRRGGSGAAQPLALRSPRLRGPNEGVATSCHQCKQRRDVQLVTCTNVNSYRRQRGTKPPVRLDSPCTKRFCITCIKRWYSLNEVSEERLNYWVCPHCRDICTCVECRGRRYSRNISQFSIHSEHFEHNCDGDANSQCSNNNVNKNGNKSENDEISMTTNHDDNLSNSINSDNDSASANVVTIASIIDIDSNSTSLLTSAFQDDPQLQQFNHLSQAAMGSSVLSTIISHKSDVFDSDDFNLLKSPLPSTTSPHQVSTSSSSNSSGSSFQPLGSRHCDSPINLSQHSSSSQPLSLNSTSKNKKDLSSFGILQQKQDMSSAKILVDPAFTQRRITRAATIEHHNSASSEHYNSPVDASSPSTFAVSPASTTLSSLSSQNKKACIASRTRSSRRFRQSDDGHSETKHYYHSDRINSITESENDFSITDLSDLDMSSPSNNIRHLSQSHSHHSQSSISSSSLTFQHNSQGSLDIQDTTQKRLIEDEKPSLDYPVTNDNFSSNKATTNKNNHFGLNTTSAHIDNLVSSASPTYITVKAVTPYNDGSQNQQQQQKKNQKNQNQLLLTSNSVSSSSTANIVHPPIYARQLSGNQLSSGQQLPLSAHQLFSNQLSSQQLSNHLSISRQASPQAYQISSQLHQMALLQKQQNRQQHLISPQQHTLSPQLQTSPQPQSQPNTAFPQISHLLPPTSSQLNSQQIQQQIQQHMSSALSPQQIQQQLYKQPKPFLTQQLLSDSNHQSLQLSTNQSQQLQHSLSSYNTSSSYSQNPFSFSSQQSNNASSNGSSFPSPASISQVSSNHLPSSQQLSQQLSSSSASSNTLSNPASALSNPTSASSNPTSASSNPTSASSNSTSNSGSASSNSSSASSTSSSSSSTSTSTSISPPSQLPQNFVHTQLPFNQQFSASSQQPTSRFGLLKLTTSPVNYYPPQPNFYNMKVPQSITPTPNIKSSYIIPSTTPTMVNQSSNLLSTTSTNSLSVTTATLNAQMGKIQLQPAPYPRSSSTVSSNTSNAYTCRTEQIYTCNDYDGYVQPPEGTDASNLGDSLLTGNTVSSTQQLKTRPLSSVPTSSFLAAAEMLSSPEPTSQQQSQKQSQISQQKRQDGFFANQDITMCNSPPPDIMYRTSTASVGSSTSMQQQAAINSQNRGAINNNMSSQMDASSANNQQKQYNHLGFSSQTFYDSMITQKYASINANALAHGSTAIHGSTSSLLGAILTGSSNQNSVPNQNSISTLNSTFTTQNYTTMDDSNQKQEHGYSQQMQQCPIPLSSSIDNVIPTKPPSIASPQLTSQPANVFSKANGPNTYQRSKKLQNNYTTTSIATNVADNINGNGNNNNNNHNNNNSNNNNNLNITANNISNNSNHNNFSLPSSPSHDCDSDDSDSAYLSDAIIAVATFAITDEDDDAANGNKANRLSSKLRKSNKNRSTIAPTGAHQISVRSVAAPRSTVYNVPTNPTSFPLHQHQLQPQLQLQFQQQQHRPQSPHQLLTQLQHQQLQHHMQYQSQPQLQTHYQNQSQYPTQTQYPAQYQQQIPNDCQQSQVDCQQSQHDYQQPDYQQSQLDQQTQIDQQSQDHHLQPFQSSHHHHFNQPQFKQSLSTMGPSLLPPSTAINNNHAFCLSPYSPQPYLKQHSVSNTFDMTTLSTAISLYQTNESDGTTSCPSSPVNSVFMHQK